MRFARPLRPRITSAITATLLGLLAVSCGGSGGDTTGPPAHVAVATVEVSPLSNTLLVAETVQLAPVTKDAGGNILTGRSVTYTSSATGIATVSSAGLVTGVAIGTATIFATSEGKSGSAAITVRQIPVNALVLTPPTDTLYVGTTAQLTATLTDSAGHTLTGRTIAWSSGTIATATISNTGLVSAIAAGVTNIIATTEGKADTTKITVRQVPVNALVLTPPTDSLLVGATAQLTAITNDSAGHPLTGRAIAWLSGTPSVATISGSGLATALAVGNTNIIATSEGKADTTTITVLVCAGTITLALGEIHTLTSTERTSLCINGGSSASEYALVPFGNSTVAATTTPITLTATNTAAPSAPLSSRQPPSMLVPASNASMRDAYAETQFRLREQREIAPAFARARVSGELAMRVPMHPYLTGIASSPTVGSVVSINVNLNASACSAKVPRAAKVVAVYPHTIVLSDTLSPSGGYSSAQMMAFGQTFDTLVYALDTLNFGAPTDIDGNGRVAILFTPGVNAISAQPGARVLGLFTSRDLLPTSSCAGSNEGEMFYVSVPDPSSTINGNYTNTSNLANTVEATLVHEFQHLINSGRRIYINNATSPFEEVWLNEGLSHIAEELLYYKMSGYSPRTNIALAQLTVNLAEIDAANTYLIQNAGRLGSFLQAPEMNSPYAQNDLLETRGAIWQLLRYSSDRKGGAETATWRALVNSTSSGQTNFNAVFGSITTMSHDWSIAQIADDAGLAPASNYTNPSWNYRSILGGLYSGGFPLLTRSLASTPVSVSVAGGGSSYVRFRIAANVVANVVAKSSGSAVPSTVDLTLIRTQ